MKYLNPFYLLRYMFGRTGTELGVVDRVTFIKFSPELGINPKKVLKQYISFAKYVSKFSRPPKYLACQKSVEIAYRKSSGKAILPQGFLKSFEQRLKIYTKKRFYSGYNERTLPYFLGNSEVVVFTKDVQLLRIYLLNKYPLISFEFIDITKNFNINYERYVRKIWSTVDHEDRFISFKKQECFNCEFFASLSSQGRCLTCGTFSNGDEDEKMVKKISKVYGDLLEDLPDLIRKENAKVKNDE